VVSLQRYEVAQINRWPLSDDINETLDEINEMEDNDHDHSKPIFDLTAFLSANPDPKKLDY
jgi:hypothetical protein